MPSLLVPSRAVAGRQRVWAVTAVGAALVLGYVLIRLQLTASVGHFVVAGARFVHPASLPEPLPVAGPQGYDGQFVYRLALEPWTTERTAHGITLDNPGYRQQRIATPVLAWALALVPGISTATALLVVNMLALMLATWYAARLVRAVGRSPWWALALAFPACLPVSLSRDLTEPVAWAGILAGLWYVRQRRWVAAAVGLTLAVLARETALLVVVGLIAGEAFRVAAGTSWWLRRFSNLVGAAEPVGSTESAGPAEVAGSAGPGGSGGSAGLAESAGSAGSAGSAEPVGPAHRDGPGWLWLAVPVLAAAGWQLVLWRVWGSLPLRSGGTGNLGQWPVLGVLDSLLHGTPAGFDRLTDNSLAHLSWSAERLALLVLVSGALVAAVRGSSRGPVGERLAWALAVGLALSLRSWAYDVQFLRAALEATGLSVLVVLGARGWWSRLPLLASVAATSLVAVEFLVVV